MTMKKILKNILVATAMLAGIPAAHAEQPTNNEDIATRLNSRCPVNYNDGMLLQEVNLKDNNFIFVYQIPDNMYANMSSLGAILHDSLVAELVSSPDKDIQLLIELCRKSGSNILQRFTDPSGNAFSITITPDDIK